MTTPTTEQIERAVKLGDKLDYGKPLASNNATVQGLLHALGHRADTTPPPRMGLFRIGLGLLRLRFKKPTTIEQAVEKIARIHFLLRALEGRKK
jgi:hypothetical protein